MRVDNNGNYKVYATKLTLNTCMEFGIFAASLPALERAYAAIDQQQLLISDQPFNHFEVNKATLCKGWDLVCESKETLDRRVVQLTEELATAHTMHVDNERYKWEQLGFGCLDELIEHYQKAKQEVEQFKSVINSEVAQLIGAGVRANYGRESVNDALAKYWVPVVALSEELSGYPTEDVKAVNRFAIAMKTKMVAARKKGRAGWDNKELCSGKELASQLVAHLYKDNAGTFEDVANFAMMLHQRGEDPALLKQAMYEVKLPLSQCKHGAILYGNECLNCTRESEQGQGGAA